MGNVLLFAHNLRAIQLLTEAAILELYFDTREGFYNRSLNAEIWPARLDWAKRLVATYAGVEVISEPSGNTAVDKSILFPAASLEQLKKWDHKTYLFSAAVAETMGKRVATPYVHVSEKALAFMRGRSVLCFHPKFDERERSNAQLIVWEKWFASLSKRYCCLILGNDPYPEPFIRSAEAKGAIFSQRLNWDIFDESYAIHHGQGFIGIASGPSNFAILSERPYLIVKHREDAWAEGFQEVVENRLPMASQGQFFYLGSEGDEFVESQVQAWA